MQNNTVVNLEKFKQCVLFTISIRRWGNRKQIKNMKALEEYLALRNAPDGEATASTGPAVSLADDRVKSTKVLLKSEALDELNSKLTAIKTAIQERSMPSFFQKGMFVLKQDQVKATDEFLRAEVQKVKDNELQEFIKALPDDIEAARSTPVKKGGLGPLFNEADYPAADAMQAMFNLEWYWVALSVPENIPDELKAEAQEKFAKRLTDAAEDIELALREQFQELMKHAVERLTPEPGGKPKVIRNSLLANLNQFIATFDSKNLFGDDRLEALIAQARVALGGLEAQKLREYASVRETAREEFAKIQQAVDGMIEEKKSRQFRLDD